MSAMVNETLIKGLFDTAVWLEADLRVQEVNLRPSRDQSGRVESEVILGQFWSHSGTHSRPISEKPH